MLENLIDLKLSEAEKSLLKEEVKKLMVKYAFCAIRMPEVAQEVYGLVDKD